MYSILNLFCIAVLIVGGRGFGSDGQLERAAGLLEEDENQDGCSDLRAH